MRVVAARRGVSSAGGSARADVSGVSTIGAPGSVSRGGGAGVADVPG